MLTKGDVLVAIGKISKPFASAQELTLDVMGPSGKRKSEVSSCSPFPFSSVIPGRILIKKG